ncbi:hypothetical protein [Mycobacterium sp. NAZ190054]|nr:hypothetical protein [Mycobacterium sp. NAZ190054]
MPSRIVPSGHGAPELAGAADLETMLADEHLRVVLRPQRVSRLAM